MSTVSFLLVDDLSENLLSLEALLRRDGLILLKAQSGDEALELLLHHDIALALIDVQMPGLNGFELAELMRGNERTRRIPIIFVTAGIADNQRRFHGYEAGAVDFIQKPIEPDVLRSKAEVFFDLYRQRQQIVAQRDELIAKAEALNEADRRKDEFLATLAHELRNPLASLRYGLDVLQRNPDAKGAADIRDVMDRQLAHLTRLIDDLLDVSRITRGKIDLRKERVQVDTIVQTAIEASRPLIERANHTLTVDVRSPSLWVDADPVRLSQVLANLLNNAAKYTPPGGRITLSARPENENLLIEVSDNGIGIPIEMQSKVFELFTQVDDHLDRARGGLGIGLSLVRQLVALHGGTVEAESLGSGKGSLFRLRMPLAADPAPTARAEINLPRDEPQTGRPLKVLVVDDNVDVAQTLGWMIEAIGHEHHVVNEGAQALATARIYRPDVVLLDIGLPDMDGYAVCRALRGDQLFKNTAIVAQTGWGQSQDKKLASEAGFSFHLTKPIGLEALEGLLDEIQASIEASTSHQ